MVQIRKLLCESNCSGASRRSGRDGEIRGLVCGDVLVRRSSRLALLFDLLVRAVGVSNCGNICSEENTVRQFAPLRIPKVKRENILKQPRRTTTTRGRVLYPYRRTLLATGCQKFFAGTLILPQEKSQS